MTWKGNSEAFGKTILEPTNKITMNLRFPGQYYDQETGTHYNYFRDYNPNLGRYNESDPIGLRGGWNTFGYVKGNPIMMFDTLGLKSVTKESCLKLKKLILLDDQGSSSRYILFSSDYHSLSFKDNILGLNADFESIGGPVDIDWMLRSASGGYGRVPGISFLSYYVGKSVWNMGNGNSPFTNMSSEGHANAPKAAYFWLSSGLKLREIFEPAIQNCECEFDVKI